MAQRPRFQRTRRRFQSMGRSFRRYSPIRRRRSTRRRTPSKMKKYLMYGILAVIVFVIMKNKEKVTDFLKKITGKK